MDNIVDSVERRKPHEIENLDVKLENISSVALRRIIEEVRNNRKDQPVASTIYNRTYHRHNR